MARMKDRVALVTGAGRGIGRSIALAFAQEGARVVVTSRTNSELEEVVAAIQEEGSEALAIAADMSDRKVPGQVIEQVQKTYSSESNSGDMDSSKQAKSFSPAIGFFSLLALNTEYQQSCIGIYLG